MTEPTATPADRHAMDVHSQLYNQEIYRAAAKWNALNDPGFAVSVQPFLTNARITMSSELSKLDCFHPSALTNKGFAVGLWNSMFAAPGKKDKSGNIHHKFVYCPDNNDFIQ
jgi:poly-D-alanine transfer protein DltD